MAGLYRVSARWIYGEIEITLNKPTADSTSRRAAAVRKGVPRERKVRLGVVQKWDGGSSKLAENCRKEDRL